MLHRDGNYLAKITLTFSPPMHLGQKRFCPQLDGKHMACLPAGSEYVSTSCTGSPNLCDLTTGSERRWHGLLATHLRFSEPGTTVFSLYKWWFLAEANGASTANATIDIARRKSLCWKPEHPEQGNRWNFTPFQPLPTWGPLPAKSWDAISWRVSDFGATGLSSKKIRVCFPLRLVSSPWASLLPVNSLPHFST